MDADELFRENVDCRNLVLQRVAELRVDTDCSLHMEAVRFGVGVSRRKGAGESWYERDQS